MDDQQLLRYGRHLLLNEFGIEGQERLLSATVLVIGAGGLGASCLQYLASAGIGRIIVADGDTVELSNLQRQVIHREYSLGQNKAESAARAMREINPTCRVDVLPRRLAGEELSKFVAEADVVVDCSDNFPTRHAINRACFALGKPLVSGAAIRFDGQLTTFDPRDSKSPCYHCLFPDADADDEERCAVMGVFAPLVGVIGSLQASETLKLLARSGSNLIGRLLLHDGLNQRWQEMKFNRDPACPVCSSREATTKKEIETCAE